MTFAPKFLRVKGRASPDFSSRLPRSSGAASSDGCPVAKWKKRIHRRNVYYVEGSVVLPQVSQRAVNMSFVALRRWFDLPCRLGKYFKQLVKRLAGSGRAASARCNWAARLQGGQHASKQCGVRITSGERDPDFAHRHPDLCPDLQ